jgi:hypothetical protein
VSEIRRIFEITLLDRIFELYDSREEALATLARNANVSEAGGRR